MFRLLIEKTIFVVDSDTKFEQLRNIEAKHKVSASSMLVYEITQET